MYFNLFIRPIKFWFPPFLRPPPLTGPTQSASKFLYASRAAVASFCNISLSGLLTFGYFIRSILFLRLVKVWKAINLPITLKRLWQSFEQHQMHSWRYVIHRSWLNERFVGSFVKKYRWCKMSVTVTYENFVYYLQNHTIIRIEPCICVIIKMYCVCTKLCELKSTVWVVFSVFYCFV